VSPVRREALRLVLDQAGVPEDALARKMIARPVFAFDLDNPLRLDDCEVCGAVDWRDCACDPTTPRASPTPAAVERSRASRLVQAELNG